MTGFLLLSLPIFGVVGLGWVTGRARILPARLLDSLSWFSFQFALPALVLRLIAHQAIGRSFSAPFFGAYLTAGGVIFALVFAASRFLVRRDLAAAGATATTATVSNLGFLGPPLMLALFGERGAGPLAMGIVAEVMVLLSVGSVIMGTAQRGDRKPHSLILRRVLCNPLLAAIAVGTAAAAIGLAVPEPVDRFLAFLGAAAGPTALFALGGALALQRIDRDTAFAATGVTVAKLVLYPALVWCILGWLLRLSPFWVQSGVLIASMPSAGSNYVLAERYQANAQQVSAAIVLSTVVSVAMFPLAAWLVMGR